MKTFEETLKKIKDNKTPTSHDSYYCLVNMINQVLRLENSITWKEEAYGERCKEIDKLKTEVDWLYKNNEHYISQLNDKKKEIEKLKEIIEKKDVQLKHYMPKR
jgi:hypothetical protein